MAKGEPFTLEARPAARPPAAAWDQLNRLAVKAGVLPLETDESALDLAARPKTPGVIESRLAEGSAEQGKPSRP